MSAELSLVVSSPVRPRLRPRLRAVPLAQRPRRPVSPRLCPVPLPLGPGEHVPEHQLELGFALGVAFQCGHDPRASLCAATAPARPGAGTALLPAGPVDVAAGATSPLAAAHAINLEEADSTPTACSTTTDSDTNNLLDGHCNVGSGELHTHCGKNRNTPVFLESRGFPTSGSPSSSGCSSGLIRPGGNGRGYRRCELRHTTVRDWG